MDNTELLRELLDLAEKLGLEVRQEFLGGGGGGLCRLRGRQVLFVDTASAEVEQVAQIASAVASLSGLESHYIKPQLRDILDQYVDPKDSNSNRPT
jgi:hypothetical protein